MYWRNGQDPTEGELYLAAEKVPAGTYRELGSGREIIFEDPDYLPASLDGRVACYIRMMPTWHQHQASLNKSREPERAQQLSSPVD